MPVKKEKNTFILSGNLAITYSGIAITQLKVPNSNSIEDMDAELVSNNAAGRKEENTWGIKTLYKGDLDTSAMNVISYLQKIILTSTQNFQ